MKKDKKMLSEQDIRKYFDKKTSTEEVNAINKKAAADPFYIEALEGYEAFQGEAMNLENVKKSLKKKIYKKNFLHFYIAGFILFVSIAAYFYIDQNIYPENTADINKSYNIKKQPAQNNSLIVSPTIPESIEKTADPRNNINSINKQDDFKRASERKRNTFKPIEIITPAVLLSPDPKQNNRAMPSRSYNFPVDYIRELKVADYTKKEMRKNNLPSLFSSNLEAKYAHENDQRKTDELNHRISYNDFLNETMDKYIAGDYKSSIAGFKLIQKHFPEDINAWFYSGLCYYNLGLSDKAIESFDKAADYYINIFDEEAEWYKALSIEMKRDNETAKILFERISQKQGFYAEKASIKLKSLD